MFNGLSPTYKALLLALLAYMAFAISDAAVKFLTSYYSVYQIISSVMALSSLFLLAFSSKLGGIKRLYDPDNLVPHLVRGIGNFFGGLLVVYFFGIMPLTSVYTVLFLSPFIMTLIAIPFFGERVGLYRWVAMIAGFGGVLIAFRPWENDISLFTFVMLLGMPLCFSIMHSMMRIMKDPCDLTIGFYPLVIGLIPMIALTFWAAEFVPFELVHLIPLFISAVCIPIGFVSVSRAYHMAEASLVAPVQYTQMIWGGVLGAMLFGDLPDLWMIIGSGIIIVSGLYLLHQERSNVS